MKKNAVVFGATGLVGEVLVDQLIHNDHYGQITLIVRKEVYLNHPKINIILLADFSKLEQFKTRLEADVYFCCIGTTINKARSRQAFRKVDLDIPLAIARLAESLKVPHLVVISSVGANAKSGNFYLRTKGEMEDEVRSAFHGGLKFIRPSLLMGQRKEKRPAEKASYLFMKTFGWLFIGPLKKYKGIDVKKVAATMIRVADSPLSDTLIEFGKTW
jgi:uncharacterized protein YbjT (DUF2867 family)